MTNIKQLILTLVALFAMTTGAWAADTYTITFSGFGNEACNKTVTDATLEYSETFNVTDVYANYTMLGGVGGSNEYVSISKKDDTQITITVKSAFEGTVNVTVYYMNENFDESERNISVTCVKSAPAITVEPVEGKTNEWTFAMPGSDVELQVEYYPGMLVKPTNLVGGTMEIEGLTDTTLPAGFEKDEEGNIYVAKDTKFTVKAVPAEGYHLVGWSDDAENKELEREFTMGDDDFILTATFSDEYDLAFEAANANTIEDGKATVKVGDTDKTATLIQDGKLTGVKYGQTVTLTAAQGYKFRSVEAKKTGSAVLAPALENGATVVIICDWGDATTTFTYTNNGGTFSGQASGYDANYFNNGLELNGKNLSFGAWNVDNSEYLSVGITFNTESSAYSYTGKGEDFSSFTISVNGTDVTDQLSELK